MSSAMEREGMKLPARLRRTSYEPRLLLMVVLWAVCSWSGCARPDVAGRLDAAPDDVAALRARLEQLDW